MNCSNAFPDWCSCVSGVPQVSVIGHLFFCLAIDSLSSVWQNSALFKCRHDDVTVLHFIRREEDDGIQREMDNISVWSRSVGLLLNLTKCCCMNIEHRHKVKFKIQQCSRRRRSSISDRLHRQTVQRCFLKRSPLGLANFRDVFFSGTLLCHHPVDLALWICVLLQCP